MMATIPMNDHAFDANSACLPFLPGFSARDSGNAVIVGSKFKLISDAKEVSNADREGTDTVLTPRGDAAFPCGRRAAARLTSL